MGHEVISQLVSYLTVEQQAKFWFRLNLKRVDVNDMLSRIGKAVINNFLGTLSGGLVILSFALFCLPMIVGIILASKAAFVFPVSTVASVLLGLAPALWKFVNAKKETLEKNISGDFKEFVQEPNYQKHLGLFHEMESDLENVFEILVDDQEPAIIFIDDLDRCSPDKIVEVIEAINLVINSKFSNKCYFILGMDGQMVAAALEEKYESLVEKFKLQEKRYGSIGWYFLDKFIQLPFVLPVLSDDKKQTLLTEFFHAGEEVSTSTTDKEAEEALHNYLENKKDPGNVDALRKIFKSRPDYRKRFIKKTIREKVEDSKELSALLARFAPYLGTSPRGIKRFANMLRFHSAYQDLREAEGDGFADLRQLSKWLAISIRYPQLVRFIQWEKEEKIIDSTIPEEKARRIDQLVERFIDDLPQKMKLNLEETTLTDNHIKLWRAQVEDLAVNGFSWLREDTLLRLLVHFHDDKSTCLQAINCNVW